jgi:Malectin domain
MCTKLGLVIIISIIFGPSNADKIIYAINFGGHSHIGSDGIVYQADSTFYNWQSYPNHIYGAAESDQPLYSTYRYDNNSVMDMELPVAGDGDYKLILKLIDKFYGNFLNISLNDRHQVATNLNVFRAAGGHYTAHDLTIKFNVEENRLRWHGEESIVTGMKMKLQIARTRKKGLYIMPSALVLTYNDKLGKAGILWTLQDIHSQLATISQTLQRVEKSVNLTSVDEL